MEKRLTASAMLFSIGFIFMLVCAVAAFFYGVQIGTSKTEAKYAAASEAAGGESDAAYHQQDLVSFYHTVFTPYREFQNEWFVTMSKLKQHQSIDAAATFKQLARLAERKSEEASAFDMQKSPLLADAQVGYIRSLKYFKDAMNAAAGSAKSMQHSELMKAVLQEKNYVSATGEALAAQKAYYEAMQKWAATIDPNLPADYVPQDSLSLQSWRELPLLAKNIAIADYLLKRNELNSFYPQDLTSRLDDFVDSGQAAKLQLDSVSDSVDLLLDTDAVAGGFFADNKVRFYQSELLPQLPFFFPDPN